MMGGFETVKRLLHETHSDSVAEEDQSQEELLPDLQAASVQSQIALGECKERDPAAPETAAGH